MAKSLDPKLLIKAITEVVQKAIEGTSGKLVPTEPPTNKALNIIEYNGRMSLNGMDKFNGPTHIAAVSFYLSDQDKIKQRAKGAIAIYIESTNTDKVLRAFGNPVADEDEEEETFAACGKVCVNFANKFKEALGASSLLLSEPVAGKNSIPQGIAFSPEQTQKQEISFYLWKKKAIVFDVTMADVPLR